MKNTYEAIDGTLFDDEFDRIDYEWQLEHPYLKNIIFLDTNNKVRTDIFHEKTYEDIEKVIVKSEADLVDFHAFAKYAGFPSYLDIKYPGVWVWNTENNNFQYLERY